MEDITNTTFMKLPLNEPLSSVKSYATFSFIEYNPRIVHPISNN